MHAGARVTFNTLVEAPGLVRLNSSGSRLYQTNFRSAALGADG